MSSSAGGAAGEPLRSQWQSDYLLPEFLFLSSTLPESHKPEKRRRDAKVGAESA